MKTLPKLVVGIFLIASGIANAQTSVAEGIKSVSSNDELPVVAVRYYYYPNLDAYYDSKTNLYLYEQQGQFIKVKEIPSGYRGYSILNNVRVAITDYDGEEPYTMLKEHQQKFPKRYAAKRQPPKAVKDEAKVAFN